MTQTFKFWHEAFRHRWIIYQKEEGNLAILSRHEWSSAPPQMLSAQNLLL